MISEQKIRDLVLLGNENRNLDYKGAFSWSAASKDEKCEIVKDVLAFANTRDGGIILIGVNDKTGALEGLTDEQQSSFDQTRFNDFVHKYTDPRHTSYVHRQRIDGIKIIVIDVPEFVDVPILCKCSVQHSSKPTQLILRQAGLYKRTEKATSELIEDADEMRELLNRALLRRQDELMFAMRQIIRPNRELALSDTNSQFENEIEGANKYFGELWDGKLLNAANWILLIRPDTFIKDRVASLKELQEFIQSSAVSLRGWTFPFAGRLGNQEWSNFVGGSQSAHDPGFHSAEALRAYQSGLIIWRSELWEQNEGRYQGEKVLSFISAIYSATEWMLFAQRYYESILAVDDTIRIEITLTDTTNRRLISANPMVSLDQQYRANISSIHLEEVVTISDLRSDALSIGRRIARRLFELFNWNNPREEMLSDWQQRLINRQF